MGTEAGSQVYIYREISAKAVHGYGLDMAIVFRGDAQCFPRSKGDFSVFSLAQDRFGVLFFRLIKCCNKNLPKDKRNIWDGHVHFFLSGPVHITPFLDKKGAV